MRPMTMLLTCTTFLGASLAHALPQHGASAIVVDPIVVRNLRAHAGKYLHVFHVSARDATFSSSGESSYGLTGTELYIREVKREPLRIRIPSSGEVRMPSVNVPRVGYMFFTHLVFAVTGSEPVSLYLTNSNGVNPRDARVRDEAAWSRLTERDFEYERLGHYRVSLLGRKRTTDDEGKTFYLLFDGVRDLGL